MGIKPDGLTIDRIDNDGDYCPENCRWANKSEQRANQRGVVLLPVDGQLVPRDVAARLVGIHPSTLQTRLRKGWAVQDALATPPEKSKQRTGKRNRRSAIAAGKGEDSGLAGGAVGCMLKSLIVVYVREKNFTRNYSSIKITQVIPSILVFYVLLKSIIRYKRFSLYSVESIK